MDTGGTSGALAESRDWRRVPRRVIRAVLHALRGALRPAEPTKGVRMGVRVAFAAEPICPPRAGSDS